MVFVDGSYSNMKTYYMCQHTNLHLVFHTCQSGSPDVTAGQSASFILFPIQMPVCLQEDNALPVHSNTGTQVFSVIPGVSQSWREIPAPAVRRVQSAGSGGPVPVPIIGIPQIADGFPFPGFCPQAEDVALCVILVDCQRSYSKA